MSDEAGSATLAPEDRVLESGHRFQPYPAYRDSGVEWLGKIPRHWGTAKIKQLATLRMGQSPPSDRYNRKAEGLPFLQGNAEFGQLNPVPTVYCRRPTKVAESGDLLLSVRAPVGAVNIADQAYGIGRGVCALAAREERADREFLYYGLQSIAQFQLKRSSTGSTYDAVSTGDIGRVVVPIPEVSEQELISDFLHRETTRVDDLIARKERLIELLEEKRTALITRAVTNGLDPDVPMKESGVEWLGEIPEGWGVARVGAVAEVWSGYPFSSEYFSLSEGVPLVRIRDLGKDKTEVCYRGDPVESAWIYKGDLIVGMDGEFNAVEWKGGKALLNQRLSCVRVRQISQRYLNYVLPFPVKMIERTKFSTTVKHLSINEIRDCKVPVPSEQEQSEIAEWLDAVTGSLDSVKNRISVAIEVLKEYRSALITAAVTGKIDVRKHAA